MMLIPAQLLSGLLLMVAASALFASSPQSQTVQLDEETEMELRRFAAGGETLLLGFPCDLGAGQAELATGEVLSEHRLEVWLADLLGAHFLPIAPSSMRSLKGEEVATLIAQAVDEREGKQIVLVAGGYGAIPALRGARIWQLQHQEDSHLLGAILFFPALTEGTPQPGKPLTYLPVVSQTSLPVVIMQPGNSPTRFWARRLKKELEKGGSRVHIETLPKVRGYFYSRRDPTPEEQAMTQRLPALVEQGVTLLRKLKEQP